MSYAQMRPTESGVSGYLFTNATYMDSPIQAAQFSTDFFRDKSVSRVTVDCALTSKTQGDAPYVETYTLSIGAGTWTREIAVPKSYLNNGISPQIFTVDNPVMGEFNLTIAAPEGEQFAFLSLEIEYDVRAIPSVAYVADIPVGHSVKLECSDETADIYYFIDDDTDAPRSYDPDRGIVFETPGDHTLRYYAETRQGIRSKEQTELIRVTDPQGLYAALNANRSIEVAGVVVSQASGYTSISDRTDAAPDECLALDNSALPRLKQARVGDKIIATGRPTDRFGSGIKALGSIQSLTINGESAVPTEINAITTRTEVEVRRYDLNGRPVKNDMRPFRRITIGSDGSKQLSSKTK